MSTAFPAQERPPEPSDYDRFRWDDTTREYIEYLEAVEHQSEGVATRRDYWRRRADEGFAGQEDERFRKDQIRNIVFGHGLGAGAVIAWAAVVFLLP